MSVPSAPNRARSPRPVRRRLAGAAVLALSATALAACASGGEPASGSRAITWYVNPDNGGQAELASKCTAQSGGRYTIATAGLPNDASDQREQLLRRLAAKDDSIDLMSLDPPFTAEFAEAGFLRTFPMESPEAQEFTAGVLQGGVESAQYEGRLAAAPFWANTQLLWYRKSVAQQAGLDPAARPVTWQQLIDAASQQGKRVDVQARRYEGYSVWINALVNSAGGSILAPGSQGKAADEVEAAIQSPEGREAATVIRSLATSKAANPTMSTAGEEVARASFQSDAGGFMVNWPYIWTAVDEAVESGTLPANFKDDMGWTRYPRVNASDPSAPPFGGINLAISAYSDVDPAVLTEAARCLTSDASSKEYFLKSGNPSNTATVYDDPEVREAWPMADVIRESITDAAPRPVTPYYGDVSSALQQSFHPPVGVDPQVTPGRAEVRIEGVLDNKQLL